MGDWVKLSVAGSCTLGPPSQRLSCAHFQAIVLAFLCYSVVCYYNKMSEMINLKRSSLFWLTVLEVLLPLLLDL